MDCRVVEGESILHEVLLLQAEKVNVRKDNFNNKNIVIANLSNMSLDVRKSLQEANISKRFLLKKLPFTDIWVLAMDEIFEL